MKTLEEFLGVFPSFAVFRVHLPDSQLLDVQFTFFVEYSPEGMVTSFIPLENFEGDLTRF